MTVSQAVQAADAIADASVNKAITENKFCRKQEATFHIKHNYFETFN